MTGRCFGVGVGPGDPELLTVKAQRVIDECTVVVSLAAKGRTSNARRVVQHCLRPDHTELWLSYPLTTESVDPEDYEKQLVAFYDDAAEQIALHLDDGEDVAVLCEGDPLFYGSYMYLHGRLAPRYATEVIPGISSAIAGASSLSVPLVAGNETFVVLSGVLDVEELHHRLSDAGAAVIMKVGRNLPRVRDAVTKAGLLDRAFYVEWATHPEQRLLPLADTDDVSAPYFSMVVIPGAGASGR